MQVLVCQKLRVASASLADIGDTCRFQSIAVLLAVGDESDMMLVSAWAGAGTSAVSLLHESTCRRETTKHDEG